MGGKPAAYASSKIDAVVEFGVLIGQRLGLGLSRHGDAEHFQRLDEVLAIEPPGRLEVGIENFADRLDRCAPNGTSST